MRNSVIHRLRRLAMVLFFGVASLTLLLATLEDIAGMTRLTMLIGLLIAGSITGLILRERAYLPWRWVLTTAMIMAVIVQLLPPLLHLPVVPEAQDQPPITVNTTADIVATDTFCSLREAIINANIPAGGDASGGDCTAGSPGLDTINLGALTYNLTITNSGIITENASLTGDLDISDDLILSGTGSTTIDAGGSGVLDDRVFHVLIGANALIANLTVRGGFDTLATNFDHGGGGIRNFGTLRLDNVVVRDNVATRNGGGIANFRTLVMTDTTIGSNTAVVYGGGLFNQRDATLTQVVIEDNNSSNRGGGVWNDDQLILNEVTIRNNAGNFGGGLYNEVGTVTLDQVTINDNVAQGGSGGGIRNDLAGVVRGTNVTISGNDATPTSSGVGGGIRNVDPNSTVVLTNSTVAANVADSANGIGNNNSSITTLYNTIVSNGSSNCINSNGGTLTDGGNNIDVGSTCGFSAGSSLSNVNPLLGSLQNNGGNTETHALLTGSPAVDRINAASCPTTDQRGQARVNQPGVGDDAGLTCDIGAYEFSPAVSVPSLSIDDVPVTEGNGGSVNAVFNVSLSASIATTVTVDYTTADDSATSGDNDYTSSSGTVTFLPNDTTPKPITVVVNGDTAAEPDETFFVNLSNSNWATISDNQGIGTINNDDFGLSINDTTVTEGDSGTTTADFTVTLSPASASTVTVNYATADGVPPNGATVADNDYVATSGTLTFTAGITEQNVQVTVNGDEKPENDETFFVNLSGASGASIVDGQGEATIESDENDIYLPIVIK